MTKRVLLYLVVVLSGCGQLSGGGGSDDQSENCEISNTCPNPYGKVFSNSKTLSPISEELAERFFSIQSSQQAIMESISKFAELSKFQINAPLVEVADETAETPHPFTEALLAAMQENCALIATAPPQDLKYGDPIQEFDYALANKEGSICPLELSIRMRTTTRFKAVDEELILDSIALSSSYNYEILDENLKSQTDIFKAVIIADTKTSYNVEGNAGSFSRQATIGAIFDSQLYGRVQDLKSYGLNLATEGPSIDLAMPKEMGFGMLMTVDVEFENARIIAEAQLAKASTGEPVMSYKINEKSSDEKKFSDLVGKLELPPVFPPKVGDESLKSENDRIHCVVKVFPSDEVKDSDLIQNNGFTSTRPIDEQNYCFVSNVPNNFIGFVNNKQYKIVSQVSGKDILEVNFNLQGSENDQFFKINLNENDSFATKTIGGLTFANYCKWATETSKCL